MGTTVRAYDDARDEAEDFVALCADAVAFRAWYDVAVRRVYAYLVTRTGEDQPS